MFVYVVYRKSSVWSIRSVWSISSIWSVSSNWSTENRLFSLFAFVSLFRCFVYFVHFVIARSEATKQSSCFAAGLGLRVSGFGNQHVCLLFLVIARSEATKQSEISQTLIATPREARLAMTLFLFSDPDARSRNPESFFLFTNALPHSRTSFTSSAARLAMTAPRLPRRPTGLLAMTRWLMAYFE